MTQRNVTLTFEDQQFPQGTVAGAVVVNIVPPSGATIVTTLADGETSFQVELSANTTYTISAYRQDGNGDPLGTVVSVSYTEPVGGMVTISVPKTVSIS